MFNEDIFSSLLSDVKDNYSGFSSIDLELRHDEITVDDDILFTSVFAYTLSRFVGCNKVLFNLVCSDYNKISLLVSCENQKVSSFMEKIIESIDYCEQNVIDVSSDIIFNLMPNEINSYDFNANIIKKNDNYTLKIIYSDKYAKNTINRFLDSFKLILYGILNVDELKDINYTTSSDLNLLDSYNQTDCPLKYDDVLDAFNVNLAKCPENSLVSMCGSSYTYGEGAFIADRIAGELRGLGVVAGDCVGFLLERSESYMFAILGILSMGGVYVPLDDKYPDERIGFMIGDSNAKVVIVSDETFDRARSLVGGLGVDVVLLNISDILRGDVGSLSCLPVVYGDLACILYTSGTTGVPKGVRVTRGAIVNLVDFYVNEFDVVSSDVFALFASIGFDVAVKCIFMPVYAGASLIIVPDEIKLNIIRLNEYLLDYGVTFTEISTQVAKLFVDAVDNESLRVLFTGGEKLGDIDIDVGYSFVDSYGPTEACVDVTFIDVMDKIDSSSIGHLLSNVKAYVLDGDGRRVPVGAVGELYLAGSQIADGYVNRDDETARAFLDNPFDDGEGYDVLYRTGDMVRILPDGTIGIVGRRDDQVKIRGNRIELSEVESSIRGLDIVDDVTVQAIKRFGNYELIAYVVASDEVEDIENYIRDAVRKEKPIYMVPSFVVKLDKIPLNVNGKVDKDALPEIDFNSLHVEYVAATNEIEKMVMESFEEVFNRERISLFDNFAHLGGDSILAIRLILSLEKKGISCRARDIYKYKTPYLIGQYIHKNLDIASYDSIEGEVDLLPIQHHFFDQITLNNYTQQFILKVKIDLDFDILQDALDELIDIHDMLRAVYRFDEGGNPIQEILPINSHHYEINEYSIYGDFDSEMRNIFIKSLKSINIKNKLMDVNLIHYNNQTYLMFVIHYLIVDWMSWNVLLVDLTYIYFRLKSGQKIELLRPYPYKFWCNDVKQLVENISDDEKQYWIKINNSINESKLKGNTVVFGFDVKVKFDVDNLLMLTEEEYFALAIARAYKNTFDEDIIFNRECIGRDESLANLYRTVGCFNSKYPIIVETNNGYDNVSLIKDVYNIKGAFKEVENLGLNYLSLVYSTHDIEFKHTPVTFNFLNNKLIFRNELLESINFYLSEKEEIATIDSLDLQSYGVTFNIYHNGDSYLIGGEYADNTYIGDRFKEFIENIKSELEFIVDYSTDDAIVCPLSESQLGVYLDEKVNDKGTAYSLPNLFKCGFNYSLDEIKNAIHALIDKHPILKGRILETEDIPLLICDSYPLIDVVEDYSNLIKPFDLTKSLARFHITENDEGKIIFYDIHHIIGDGVSCTIIDNELALALDGNLDHDMDLGFVYASRDSFGYKFESSYDEAHDFYVKHLSDLDEVGTFMDDFEGVENCIRLPLRGIKKDIEVFCHKQGITLNNFLNAVFAYTYSRFIGTDKVYYTFTEHGRHEEYSENALGMFVHTIPIIVNCENTSVNEFLSNVSDLISDSMKHNVYPFRFLSQEFNINNNVSFEYNIDFDDFSYIGDDLLIENLDFDLVTDFLCYANDLDDGYLISVESCDKYCDDTVIRFLNVFKEVLLGMLDKEELSDINYTSLDDLKELDIYNNTEKNLKYEDILNAFNDNLARYPDKILVSMGDKSYTYAEGAYIADKIAKSLIRMGVNYQDCVSFLLERSELYMFCVLGILSAGLVYVPLDDALPDERVSFILDDTRSKVVVVSEKTCERVSNLDNDCKILNISDIIYDGVGVLSNLPIEYGDLACILYTSGTTGIPKGVKVTRKSILNVISFYADAYGLDNDDVYGLYSNIGFDGGSLGICQALYVGCSLVVVPEHIRFDMVLLNDYYVVNGVTHSMMPTQVAKSFMGSVENDSLDVLLVGGEKLGVFKNHNDYELVDGFGPTESFAFISSINNADKITSSSIGRLGYNTKVYILDNEGRRVPIGAIGELYISGYQVARGYLNRAEESEISFIKNPFNNDESYDTLYRSGDMVRVLSDGSLSIVGRRDSQVKIRGNRVELSEIEKVIHEIDFVDDVTVQTIKNGTNNELVAYIVSDKDLDLKDSICDYIAKRKPNYMIPSHVIKMDSIPLTVNGKVDKGALLEVDLSSSQKDYVAPSTETERLIVEVFEEVFKQKKIGLNDNFLQLGGDSLTSIKITFALSKKGITVNMNTLNKKTIYEIAKDVDRNVSEYGFSLVKKGTSNQNMFFIPPISGTSFVYLPLINHLDFDGNVYTIDDFKFTLPIEEIKKTDIQLALDKYYEAIKDLFQDGDILVAFSQGCIFSLILANRLEQEKKIGKCILIDGVLDFKVAEEFSDERIWAVIGWADNHFDLEKFSQEPLDIFFEKLFVIWRINSTWDFNPVTVYSPVLYLSTQPYNENLNIVAPNAEYVHIDAEHLDLIGKAIPKIIKYLK